MPVRSPAVLPAVVIVAAVVTACSAASGAAPVKPQCEVEINRLADAFYAGYSRFDIPSVLRLLDPTVTIWSNISKRESPYYKPFGESGPEVRKLLLSFRRVPSHRVVQCDGWAQEHRTIYGFRDGTELTVWESQFVKLKGGRVITIRDYSDPEGKKMVGAKIAELSKQ